MIPAPAVPGKNTRNAVGENKGTVLLFPSPCFRIEEVLVSTLTFAGVGKTVIAAFDYKRFKKTNSRARLLFVAHRKEIMAAFGFFTETESPEFREGVKYFDDKRTDIFLINLNKSEKEMT